MTIDAPKRYRYSDRWTKIANSEVESLKELVKVLERSETGKKVLDLARKKARRDDQKLWDILLPGQGSLTDTTLIRKFSPRNPGQITYETRSKVYINRNLSVKNAILDMAHELVHYSLRDPFNPYQNFSDLKEFITSTVEGKGGEVEAYLIECKVMRELFDKNDTSSNCFKVIDPSTDEVSKKLGIEQFYQLGQYSTAFKSSIHRHDLNGHDFDSLSNKQANFISSAYGLPYPLAAIHEYESILARVCENDERRLALMSAQAKKEVDGVDPQYRKLASLHQNRCRKTQQ